MGKKHLLYIHHERFASEAKKSDLVNKLLNDYYDSITNWGMDKEPLKNTPPIIVKAKPIKKIATKSCKHGYTIGSCFDKKSEKDCR